MPHSPTAASAYLQPGPFVPLGSPPPLAVFASTSEVRRLLEQLRPHTERLIGLFKEWDDDGSKITRKQFALTVQLLHQQVWLEAPAGSRTGQAPPSRVLVGCFDLVDKAKVGTVELADLVTFLRAHSVMGDAGLLDATVADATKAEPRGYPRPSARVASPDKHDRSRGSPGFARPRVAASQQAVRGAGSPARGARRGSVQSDGNGSYGIMASYDDDGVQLIETRARREQGQGPPTRDPPTSTSTSTFTPATWQGPTSSASRVRSARPKSPKRPGMEGEGGAPSLALHASLLPWHARADGERELSALTAYATVRVGVRAGVRVGVGLGVGVGVRVRVRVRVGVRVRVRV